MSNQNGYIGRSPGDSAVIIASQTFEPTGIQTDFTFASGYDPGYIDVYFNGARLVYANDYTATNGSTVGLTTYANNGDVLELVAYKAFNVGAVDAANGNFSVGNQLTVSGVTTATSAYYTGIVTATSFSGDGSSLTGLANTDVINTENINVIGVATVGSAVTINSTGIDAVSGVITAANFVGGGANITALSGTNIASGTVAAARVATLNQNTTGTSAGLTGTPNITINNITGVAATFTGVLTYEDVTNVDSVGIVTARGGLEVGAAGVGGTVSALGHVEFVGVTTIGLGLTLTDNIQARFGDAGDLKIYHNGSHSYVDNATGSLFVKTDNQIYFQDTGGNRYADFVDGGAVKLYYSNAAENKKFETTETGTITTGISTADGFSVGDNEYITAGVGSDLSIYHNGTHNYIQGSTASDLIISNNGNFIVQTDEGETCLRGIKNAYVDLYYNGSKKFETTNSGTITTGISTVTVGTDLDGYKVEEGSTAATSLNGEFDYELENGHVQRYSSATGGNYFPDFRVSSSQSLSSVMDVGDVVTCTLIVASSSHYCTTGIKIDNSTSNIDLDWVGGTAPAAANGSGFDVYSFTIMKTAATPAYHIIGNASGVA